MIFAVKLLLSHLLGDFVFQPKSWVVAKDERGLRAWQFYVHILIHALLLALILCDKDLVLPALVIVVSHGVIDAIKLRYQKRSKRAWFAIDQAMHLVVLVIVWYVIDGRTEPIVLSESFLLFVTAMVFLTIPSSVIIKTSISHWTPKSMRSGDASLQNAGNLIGILERLMVFTFISVGSWEAVGFLLAAKSVFRFGDLKESKELKLTEYVLIGTLLSFGIAIALALTVRYLSASL
jgi:hypothetical protein